MMEQPFKPGALIKALRHQSLMRGTPQDATRDTVLIEPGEVLMVHDTEFQGKNPHNEWWYIHVVHGNAVHWCLMTTKGIAEGFEKIDVRIVALDLQDRMLDEDDWPGEMLLRLSED